MNEQGRCEIKVSNIPFDITEDDLMAFFAQVGPVKRIVIPKERDRQKGVGHAFCEFYTKELADSAVKNLNKTELKKRVVFVTNHQGSAPQEPKSISRFFRSLNSKELKYLKRKIKGMESYK